MSLQNAFLGSLAADATAMPVHWYYDTWALDRDYPELVFYTKPRNHHPDSILWRSSYQPAAPGWDILGEQANYYGQQEIHYHQFLRAGENTLNLKLAIQLYRFIIARGGYDPEAWLKHYVELMKTPSWHGDTYLEEYHRKFFTKLSRGENILRCGNSSTYIGALSQVPALLAALEALGLDSAQVALRKALQHVTLTHKGMEIERAVELLVGLLLSIRDGQSVRNAIEQHAGEYVSLKKLLAWTELTDRRVIGSKVSPACYLPDSMTASLYLAWKYHDDLETALLANSLVGGDSCHRGVVVGSLVALRDGLPDEILRGLAAREELDCAY